MTNREYIESLSDEELARFLTIIYVEETPWDDYAMAHTRIFVTEEPLYKAYNEAVTDWLKEEYKGDWGIKWTLQN